VTLSNFGRYPKSLSPFPSLLHQISSIFKSFDSQIFVIFFTSIAMTKGEKSNAVSGAGKGKAATEEKGKDLIAPGFVWILTLKPPSSIARRRAMSI